MFDQVISKAVELFHAHEFDENDEALDALLAWAWALDVVKTDEDALTLLTEILGNPDLKSKVEYWDSESATFDRFVRGSLHVNSGFAEMVAAKIEGYEQLVDDRKQRANDRFSQTQT